MIGVYIRIKMDGNQNFPAGPTESEYFQYWFKP
jgi:hypothetical protein